jgi:hypothetical protein
MWLLLWKTLPPARSCLPVHQPVRLATIYLFQLFSKPCFAYDHTANEGPVRIQYKCLVPIYVFPEMKLLFSKQNYNVLSPSSYTHISVRDLYNSRMGLPFLLQENMWTDPGNI